MITKKIVFHSVFLIECPYLFWNVYSLGLKIFGKLDNNGSDSG